MKKFVVLLAFFSAGLAHAEVGGSSSMELDLPPTVQELNRQIVAWNGLAAATRQTLPISSYGFRALAVASEIDRDALLMETIEAGQPARTLEATRSY
jgi:hypothetical protein